LRINNGAKLVTKGLRTAFQAKSKAKIVFISDMYHKQAFNALLRSMILNNTVKYKITSLKVFYRINKLLCQKSKSYSRHPSPSRKNFQASFYPASPWMRDKFSKKLTIKGAWATIVQNS